ncbi:MAG: hypothetical protein QOC94_4255 [Actinoplanes sp.]|nr:hypothetical protein [Actinoplanes sp.]
MATTARTSRFMIISGLLALATVGTYWLFLGRDQTMQLDPATGNYGGPWTTGQVAGCVLTMLVLLIGAVCAGLRPVLAAAVMTLAFVVPWTIQAAATDETGMYGVGLMLILVGMGFGTWLVALLTAVVARAWRPERRRGAHPGPDGIA